MPFPTNFATQLEAYVQEWTQKSSQYRAYHADEPFPHFVLTERADSWRACLDWLSELQGSSCFRGQRESSWHLNTVLDRETLVTYEKPNSSGQHHLDRDIEEQEMFIRFQQQAHHYEPMTPSADDFASWLAMMQHYGVPTRLLDWTASPYVALYFSFAEEPSGSTVALWALDLAWLRARAESLLDVYGLTWEAKDALARVQHTNRLLRLRECPIIVHIDPSMTSERMAAQQGLLLCKTYNEVTFSQILVSMITHPELPDRPVVRKLEIEKGLRTEVLQRLQDMNINNASLFPGLDGFAKSLKMRLQIKALRESARLSGMEFERP